MNKTNTQRWKDDIAKSVDFYNQWFIEFAPKAYLETRRKTTEKVENTFRFTNDLHNLTADVLKKIPQFYRLYEWRRVPRLHGTD